MTGLGRCNEALITGSETKVYFTYLVLFQLKKANSIWKEFYISGNSVSPQRKVSFSPRNMGQLLLLLLFYLPFATGNRAPSFDISFAKVKEDLFKDEWAFNLTAIDPDGDPLTYDMYGEDAVHFSLTASTGEVFIKIPVDFEEKTRLNVDVSVTDNVNAPTERSLPVIVDDANDNRPIFQNLPYAANIPENTAKGSVIFDVNATDADKGVAGVVNYLIEEIIPTNAHFFIRQTTGEVVLNSSLNYNNQSTFYQLKILAIDGCGEYRDEIICQNSTTFLSINIVDVPDLNPVFLTSSYSAQTFENSAKDTFVLQVSAVDPDKGINDKINYSISGSSLFAIDIDDGRITVNDDIDRENLPEGSLNSEIILEVTATEHNVNVYGKEASTSVNITIKIEDINDNKPEFYNCSDNLECRFTQESQQDNFAVEIEEHSSRGVPVITIGAKDSDEGINSRFVLYLEGPNANVFTVSPNVITGSSSFQLFVADSVALDYEKTRTMNVVIVANDTGNSADCCSEANITIRLLDINDHSPEFPHQTYTLEVKEHSADGSLVSNITAFDPDSGCFGNITYDLRPATLLNTLEINKLNGEITVKNSILLDRETRPNYFITLVGTDCGDRVGSTVIELNLIDINDYTPTGRQIYNTFWRENANNPPLDIEAFDNDEPENNNSKVQYHIEPGTYSQNFTIGLDDGNLNHYGNLDREDIHIDLNGQITLNVSACDLGEPRNCFFINVTINVEDTNDNLPVFNQSSYNFTVKESEKGIYVNNVTAKDGDQTVANSRLTFQITNGGMGSFTIRSATDNEREGYHGMISVDREIELNYETTKSYTLTVEALDIDSQSAMATVHIEVIDVNDERPSLIPASLNGESAFENMTGLGVITNVLGTDPDTNHSLIYQALDVQCRKNGSSIEDLCHGWFWLHENGSVFINESESVVDFEQCDEVWITVQVIDVYTEKYTDNGKNNYSDPGVLTIAIEDINDNRPEFISQDDVFVAVSEIPLEATVKAWDADVGNNAVISFSISKVIFVTPDEEKPLGNGFTVSSTLDGNGKFYLGSIKISQPFDPSLKGHYQVTVIASDGGNPALIATTEIKIFNVDQSYRVSLQFSVAVDEIKLDEVVRTLQVATDSRVFVVEKKPVNTRNKAKSVLVMYFVYMNGSAILPNDISRIIQNDVQTQVILSNLGLLLIDIPTTPEDNTLTIVIIGLSVAFIIVFVVMTTILVCETKRYKKKLKSMSAMKTAKEMNVKQLTSAQVVPGTNIYTTTGANPMLDMNIDLSTDLGYEEESNTDDRTSLNSLDENNLDMTEKPQKTSSNMILDMNIRSDNDEEPLTAALAERDKNKKPEESDHVLINPAFNTTDL